MADIESSVSQKQQQRAGLFLAWILCFIPIPLLSFTGRPLQILVCSMLSPFQLSVLFLIVSIIIFLLPVCNQKTLNDSKKVFWKILWVGTGFAVLSLALPPVERVHVLLFALFGFLSQRVFGTRGALVICLAVSGLDELLQYFLPDRVGDWRDVLTNVISSVLGLALSSLLSPIDDKYISNSSI